MALLLNATVCLSVEPESKFCIYFFNSETSFVYVNSHMLLSAVS